MKTFIKVTEIWVPAKERAMLELGAGLYGTLTDFQASSETRQFAYNEGLPGKAWASGRPIILTEFTDSYFMRAEAARQSGLTCGIALPVFSGEFLMAVIVFLCGDDEEHAGAIEIWSNQATSGETLCVIEGYYGTLQEFETLSRTLIVAPGCGLAGQVWASGMPVLIEDLGCPPITSRGEYARQAGITTGLGIPVVCRDEQVYIMTLLSAKATPIAKRLQIWVPDAQGEYLICQSGYSQQNADVAKIFESLSIRKGEGALGRSWLTGVPVISGEAEFDYLSSSDKLSSMLAVPVIDQGHLKAIVTFLF